MQKKKLLLLTIFLLGCQSICFCQTWVDTLDLYAREKHLPSNRYLWTWQNASLLKVMVMQYELRTDQEKQTYLDYIKRAMNRNMRRSSGKTPNGVASGLGMAFLYRITGEQKYLDRCDKIFNDYQNIKRTDEGAVSHMRLFRELWDDTVFMIGQFFLEMYKATGEEKYIDEFLFQFKLHRDKLKDKETGLWVHGWSAEERHHISFCSQRGWPDEETGRSKEIWGRGNGWVVVTLADVLLTIPDSHPHREEFTAFFLEMVEKLPKWQDEKTGHWYQLPVKHQHPDNFIESSATAMFAYGITVALKLGLLSDSIYQNSIKKAYNGLRQYSMESKARHYLIPANVCKGTCIGDENYYYKRNVRTGTSFGIGSFIQFGLLYEMENGIKSFDN